MSRFTPTEMARAIGGRLLSFPVTPFRPDLSFDSDRHRHNIDWLAGYDVAVLFVTGGKGEFFSLTPEEVATVVAVAVGEVAGRVPVIAGIGYGTATAWEMAQAAGSAGADGILLLPPYLLQPSQNGLFAHVRAVCAATRLGVIVYNRDIAVLTEDPVALQADACPNLVGFKDRVGDVELMTRVQSHLGGRLTYVGGLPTAETFAPAYRDRGVTTYS